MAINKEKLIKGRNYQENFYLDDEDFVVLRRLSIGEVQKITSDKNKSDIEIAFEMVSGSLVDPQLTVEEVKELVQKDFVAISERVIEMSGVDEEKLQKEVETFRQDQ